MGYLHIDNLYKNQEILAYPKCYALEKIHGTSAHIRWNEQGLGFHSGGAKHEEFLSLFDRCGLEKRFDTMPLLFPAMAGDDRPAIVVYGEAYGGKMQANAWRYGPVLRFVAFDVKVDGLWLSVPKAEEVVHALGLEFVYWQEGPTTLEWLDSQRDAPSEQARRNGVQGDQPREGVVLRPLIEVVKPCGTRIIAKHKRPDERETKTIRIVGQRFEIDAGVAAAREWVTSMRLDHVLDHLQAEHQRPMGIADIPKVVLAMQEDVAREGAGEVLDDKTTRKAIGHAVVDLFKRRLRNAGEMA